MPKREHFDAHLLIRLYFSCHFDDDDIAPIAMLPGRQLRMLLYAHIMHRFTLHICAFHAACHIRHNYYLRMSYGSLVRLFKTSTSWQCMPGLMLTADDAMIGGKCLMF